MAQSTMQQPAAPAKEPETKKKTTEERIEALEKKFERLTVLIGEDPPEPEPEAESKKESAHA